MPEGKNIFFWKYYNDTFIHTELSAEPAADRVVGLNEKMLRYISNPASIRNFRPHSFFPPALSAGAKDVLKLPALMTSGRSFILSEEAMKKIGLDDEYYLDLSSLGWGNGYLQLKMEIKGCGTLFERTMIDRRRLHQVLHGHAGLSSAFHAASSDLGNPAIFSSLGLMHKNNAGGQSERMAIHALMTSINQLGISKIKFAPTWMIVQQSPAIHRNLGIVSEALEAGTGVFDGLCVNELRFTPGTVRALYFDNVENDRELVELCKCVSTDITELEESLDEMIEDARRYLELLAQTAELQKDEFYWIKIGDINEKFRRDANGGHSAAEEYKRKKYSWYLAKDEIVVRKVGKFFVDMESFFGRDTGLCSKGYDELIFHHELVIINVLRDHNRVCTQFKQGIELLKGRSLHYADRKQIRRDIIARLMHSINKSEFLTLDISSSSVILDIAYSKLGTNLRYTIPRRYIAERHA